MGEPLALDMYIDGKRVGARSGERFDVLNPATGEPYATVPKADVEDVDAAVDAARRAFEGSWREVSAIERGALLQKIARALEARAEEFSVAETSHNGKTIGESEFDVSSTVGCFDYYAGAPTKYFGETIQGPSDYLLYTRREPVGVCGLIVPWNYPLAIAVWKLAPALAAGCTVVLKPASDTPVTALMLAEVAEEAGFPPGVVNVVTGPGSVIGRRLAAHSGVDKVSITGETTTGRDVMREAAESLKRITLELGGKSPAVVFADADLEAAVDASMFMIYTNAGQVCDARSRIFVQQPAYEEFVARFVDRTAKLRVGDPMDRSNHIGAITSARQLDRVDYYVELGQKEGAKLAVGGERVVAGGGYFYRPTAFVDVDNSMRIAQEEIFGPVACIAPFRDYDEGIRLANDTVYGLAATVWTADLTTAHRAAHDIKAGGVWVNTSEFLFNESPFGGMKASGFGRELSLHGLDAYTEVKNVGISLGAHLPMFEL
jgi:acyl-CoA reductase-like NAD-dependent aldehyde dehydrogenase